MNQSTLTYNSPLSVAEYYSGELVSFLRRILAVVPETVFHLLNSVIAALNERMKPLPAKMEQPHLKVHPPRCNALCAGQRRLHCVPALLAAAIRATGGAL